MVLEKSLLTSLSKVTLGFPAWTTNPMDNSTLREASVPVKGGTSHSATGCTLGSEANPALCKSTRQHRQGPCSPDRALSVPTNGLSSSLLTSPPLKRMPSPDPMPITLSVCGGKQPWLCRRHLVTPIQDSLRGTGKAKFSGSQ